MFGKFPFLVFPDHFLDFIHSFNNKHLRMAKSVLLIISVFSQECIISCIKCVYRIQKTCQMIIDCSSPDKCITVCVCFDFCLALFRTTYFPTAPLFFVCAPENQRGLGILPYGNFIIWMIGKYGEVRPCV